MRLNWIEFENRDINLKIERVYFNKDITLLVGLTGSGKSQIINAIQVLCGIATNSTESFQRVSVILSFDIDGKEFVWEVRTEYPDDDIDYTGETKLLRSNYLHMMYYDPKTIIAFERLSCGEEVLFERSGESSRVKGFDKIPQVDNTRSFISLYSKEEQLINVLYHLSHIYQIWSFRSIVYKVSLLSYTQPLTHHSNRIDLYMRSGLRYNDLFPRGESLIIKIALLKKTNSELWENVFENYKAIFPEVDDITIEQCSSGSDAVTIFFIINGDKVDVGNISSGMIKILQYIVDIQTASDNNIILIDEVENGLGINCVDSVWEIIKKQSNNAQFIVTSHHPYIISNLDYKKLKIIRRERNIIKTYSGDDFELGETSIDSYDAIFNKLLFGENK